MSYIFNKVLKILRFLNVLDLKFNTCSKKLPNQYSKEKKYKLSINKPANL